jgi:DNA-binding MarR family transcriptional regulator
VPEEGKIYMRKIANDKLPSSQELSGLSKQINIDFIKYITFADTVIRYIEIALEQTNVSRLQAGILHFLVLHKGKWTPSQLAKIMFRSKHSLTKLLDGLEQQGLIVRDNSEKDRRVTHIRITPAGVAYVEHLKLLARKWTDTVVSCLNEEERKTFMDYINRLQCKMADNLKQSASKN